MTAPILIRKEEKAAHHAAKIRAGLRLRLLSGPGRLIIPLFSALVLLTVGCKGQSSLKLVQNHRSAYRIVLPGTPTKNEQRAAQLLQKIIEQSTGAELPIITEGTADTSPAIYIGETAAAERLNLTLNKTKEGYRLHVAGNSLFLTAGQGHSPEYAVYYFVEKYLHARKYDKQNAVLPKSADLEVPQGLDEVSLAAFNYRESYLPLSQDPDYLNWHGLQRFEDLWGLWGHSYFKLMPPARYFKSHPEYYALVNGSRRPTQLCLSNASVLALVIDTLKVMMEDNPDAIYWSVSPNDGGGYCTCDSCKKLDMEEGGPQGSLIHFVNAVAAAFPDKKITTLAYGGTADAPLKTHARSNVIVLLSSIDLFRESPVRTASYAAAVRFRRQLKDWSAKASHIFIWDYAVQFTNYLAPFPDIKTMADNFKYFKAQGVEGVFEQGSGEDYSDASALKSYVQAKLLWQPEADVDSLIRDFCAGYYGAAAPYVLSYFKARQAAVANAGKHLDIYGNPILETSGFLSPSHMAHYQKLLDSARAAVNTHPEPLYLHRVGLLQLGLDFAALQQARFYGLDPGGFLIQGNGLNYTVRPDWRQRIDHFTSELKKAEIINLSEDGLTVNQYLQQWQDILSSDWPANLALHGQVSLKYPFAEDYPAKGNQTLIDGMRGFKDFSYNWLCFYGTDLEAVVDMGQIKACGKINVNFLDDPRHWIFLPTTVQAAISLDGMKFTNLKPVDLKEGAEHSDIRIVPAMFNLPPGKRARYIKIKAINPGILPAWRNEVPKKPMIAADEIRVTP